MDMGIDVDDVLGDFGGPWLAWYNRKYNDNLINWTHWEVDEQVKPEARKAIFGFIRPAIYEFDIIQPYEESQTVLSVLRKAGHRLMFVTHCVNGTAGAKLEWLIRHALYCQGDSFMSTGDKGEAPVDFLVDDYSGSLAAYGGAGLLVSRPHNAADPWLGPRIPHIRFLPAWLAKRKLL